MQRKIDELQREIEDLLKRFENEKNGLSQTQNELRDMYEKRIADIKNTHSEEMRKLRDDYEKRIRELQERAESDLRDMRISKDREREGAVQKEREDKASEISAVKAEGERMIATLNANFER